MARYVFLTISALIAIAVLVISVQNGAGCAVLLFGSSLNVPLGAVSASTFVLGALAASSLLKMQVKQVQVDQKLLEWQSQDAKLAVEVESDRVKQLEAKIATLEAALDSALKRAKNKA